MTLIEDVKSASVWKRGVLRGAYGLAKALRRRLRRPHLSNASYQVVQPPGFHHAFCGYYDDGPFYPKDESLLLVHLTDLSLVRHTRGQAPVTLAIVNWQENRIVETLGESLAWNWQQGARALWLPDGRWIFNRFDDKSAAYVSVVGSLNATRPPAVLPHPVQAASRQGELYSIDYSVLSAIRPDYGYFCIPPREPLHAALIRFTVDSPTGDRIVEVAALADETEKRLGTSILVPKINHVLPSPSGDSLVYMFRFRAQDRRVTNVYHLNLRNMRNSLLLEDRNTSHYCWTSEHQLVVTCNAVSSEAFGYHLIDTRDTGSEKLMMRSRDGHPTAIDSGRILSDSYADKDGVRKLWTADCRGKTCPNHVAEFVEPWYLWGERRCDLHPSLSASKRFWQCDVVRSGSRCVAVGTMES